jgi:hypothetical protein
MELEAADKALDEAVEAQKIALINYLKDPTDEKWKVYFATVNDVSDLVYAYVMLIQKGGFDGVEMPVLPGNQE